MVLIVNSKEDSILFYGASGPFRMTTRRQVIFFLQQRVPYLKYFLVNYHFPLCQEYGCFSRVFFVHDQWRPRYSHQFTPFLSLPPFFSFMFVNLSCISSYDVSFLKISAFACSHSNESILINHPLCMILVVWVQGEMLKNVCVFKGGRIGGSG